MYKFSRLFEIDSSQDHYKFVYYSANSYYINYTVANVLMIVVGF